MYPLLRTQTAAGSDDRGGLIGELLTDQPGPHLGHLLTVAEHHAIVLATAVVAAVTGICALATWVRRRRERRWAEGARQVEILIPPQVQPEGAQVLWEHLHGAIARTPWQRLWSGQHLLGFEYRITPDEGAIIRLWVPSCVPPHLVENTVTVAWRGARTHTMPAAPPLPLAPPGHRSLLAGGELHLGRHARWPIRTNSPGDPAAALINAAQGMEPGSTACIQVLARPVTTRHTRHTASSGAAQGVAGLLLPLGREFFGLFTPGPVHTGSTPARTGPKYGSRDRQLSLQQSAQDHAAAAKARDTQWATVVRYAVTAPVPLDADRVTRARVAAMVRGRALAVSSYLSGASGDNHYRRRRRRRRRARLRDALTWRRLGRGDLLSAPELAVLAHLPGDAGIAEIHRAGARALAPSEVVASGGPDTKPLGRADAVGGRQVAMRVPDARHHVHVLGPTGCGKSTLLGQMVLADADAARGLVLIDPKGDLVTDILTRLPDNCGGRVVLFDADSASPPPCINPLDLTTFGGEVDLVVDNTVTVFRRIYHQFWGPRTDDVFRSSLLTVCTQPRPATLADVARLLTDDTYRARLTSTVKDPVLHGFWRTFEAMGESGRNQLTAPLLNKLRHLLLRPFVKTALAGGPATVDLGGALDHGGLVLARLPKGRLGEETTRLIGALLVARTWQAATARAATPARERRDAALYLDEFHNFLHSSTPVEDMLAEARALKLSMVLAHQNLGQLTPTLREAISTNARNKIYFAVSPEDSRDLARHTLPQLSEHDLAHLDAYHAATRLVVKGHNIAPCTVATEPLPPPVPGRARRIRAAARAHTAPRPTSPPAAPASAPKTSPAPEAPRNDPRRG